MARPLKQIDPKKVERLAMVGCPPHEIAAELGCGEMTIHRRFGTLVKQSERKGKTRIRSRLYKLAMQGNVPATIFLCKAWLGMREMDPVSINVSANAVTTFGLSDQQQKQITRLAEQIQHRVFCRDKPQLEPARNGANGNPPALSQ